MCKISWDTCTVNYHYTPIWEITCVKGHAWFNKVYFLPSLPHNNRDLDQLPLFAEFKVHMLYIPSQQGKLVKIHLVAPPPAILCPHVPLSFAVHDNYQNWFRELDVWLILQHVPRVVHKIVAWRFTALMKVYCAAVRVSHCHLGWLRNKPWQLNPNQLGNNGTQHWVFSDGAAWGCYTFKQQTAFT